MLMVEKTFDSSAKVQDHKYTINNHTGQVQHLGTAVKCCGQAQLLSSLMPPLDSSPELSSCSDF